MTRARIAIASDHAGLPLKRVLCGVLEEGDYEIDDLGTHDEESVDYPDFAEAVAMAIKNGAVERGVLVCGTGIGIAIAANRFPWVRAGVCHDATSARLTRAHNNANVIAMGARLIGTETAKDCLKVFLETPYEGGRHDRRVDKLSRLPC